MSDPALTAEQEQEEARIEAEVEARFQARLEAERAQAEAARVEALKAAGAVAPVQNPNALPSWYPAPAPIEEDLQRRVFPRGTSVAEVLEYDRLQAAERLAEQGLTRAPAPLPEGTVTASAEEFSYRG